MTNKETIHVFFATTDNYVKYLDVAMISLINNASKDYDYKIVVLHNGLSDESIKNLMAHSKDNITVELKNVESELKDVRDTLPDKLHFTMASYYRLFIETLYPNIDKGIYLDCDLIVNGDISKLYNIDLGDNLLGAVNEQNCFLTPLMTQYTIEVAGLSPYKFFNTGVLLMNLKEIRKFQLKKKFIDMLVTYNFESPMVDQDYLNNICRHRVKLLPNSWNKESVACCPLEGDLYIRHFSFAGKPWKTKEIPDAELFWKYVPQSAYRDIIQKEYEAVTPADLQRDMQNAGKMMEIVHRLLQSDHTFKKVIIDKEDK